MKERIEDTLAEKPDDPQALAALGEIKLDEKDLASAVDLFRRSYALEANPATRVQLVEGLLEGLRGDFAAYRQSLDELDQLIQQPRHRVEYLRFKAMGLQQAGEVLPAFETYLQLVDEQAPWETDDIDENLSVRRDRWIREQLAQLRNAADLDTERRIDAIVNRRLEDALAADSVEVLRSFVSVFGSLPVATTARTALVNKLAPDELLEQSLLLQNQILSSDDAVAGPAVARMAVALAQAGRPELAAVYYRQLAGRLADVVCLDGQTGRQLVASVTDDDVRTHLGDGDWPTGSVTAQDQKLSLRGRRIVRPQRNMNLEIVGARGPLFQDVNLSIVFDAQQHLVADDGLGRNRFRVLLSQQNARRFVGGRSAYNIPSISYASVHGGLVVLSMGTHLVAIDTIRSGDTLANRVLWTEDLNDQLGGVAAMQSIVPRPVNLKWGGARYVPEDGYGRRYGTIGPVTSGGVYFQRLHDLYCVDPLTGKTIWMRNNVPQGLDLFGDDEFLLAAPVGEGETLVLRASTGELVGTRRVAAIEDRMTILGRCVLSWQLHDGHPRVEMRDVVADRVLWSYDFAAGSKAAIVAEDVVGVYQPDGEFSLVRLSDGKRLAHERLETVKTLLGIHLLSSEQGYLLATHAAAPANSNRSVQPYPNVPDCPLVTGHLYAFDRDGQPRWPKPVAVTQQGLLLSQPSELPVLVLLRQMNRPGPISSRDPKLSVMCIDKRTGEVVYHKDDLQGTTISSCTLEADPTKHTVTITLPGHVITLAYTPEKDLPQASATSPDERQAAARVILEAIGFPAASAASPVDTNSK